MPIYHIKKVLSKIAYFGHSGAIIRSKLGLASIYGHTVLVHNLVIFGPISKFFILGCSGDQYLSDEPLFGRFWGKINTGLRRRPVTGAPVARNPKVAETPKLHQKFPLSVGLSGKPLSRNQVFPNIWGEPPPLTNS